MPSQEQRKPTRSSKNTSGPTGGAASSASKRDSLDSAPISRGGVLDGVKARQWGSSGGSRSPIAVAKSGRESGDSTYVHIPASTPANNAQASSVKASDVPGTSNTKQKRSLPSNEDVASNNMQVTQSSGQQSYTGTGASPSTTSSAAAAAAAKQHSTFLPPRKMLQTEAIPSPVHRWLAELRLTRTISIPRHDLRSGYIVADILLCYYPHCRHELQLVDGFSLDILTGNWRIISKFLRHTDIVLKQMVIDGIIHIKHGAAVYLLNILYQHLTGNMLPEGDIVPPPEGGWTDVRYQSNVPHFARPTATQAVKNNLCVTEVVGNPEHGILQQKAISILNDHQRLRKEEKITYPGRFKTKPQLHKFPTAKPKHIARTKPVMTRSFASDRHATLGDTEIAPAGWGMAELEPMSKDAAPGYRPPTITFQVTDLHPERRLTMRKAGATGAPSSSWQEAQKPCMFALMPKPDQQPDTLHQRSTLAAGTTESGVSVTGELAMSSPSVPNETGAPKIRTLHDTDYTEALYLEEIVRQDRAELDAKEHEGNIETKISRYDRDGPSEEIISTLHPECNEVIGYHSAVLRDKQYAGYRPKIHRVPLYELVQPGEDGREHIMPAHSKLTALPRQTNATGVPGDPADFEGIVKNAGMTTAAWPQPDSADPLLDSFSDDDEGNFSPDPNLVRLLVNMDIPEDEHHNPVNKVIKEEQQFALAAVSGGDDEESSSDSDFDDDEPIAFLQTVRSKASVEQGGPGDVVGIIARYGERVIHLTPHEYMLYQMYGKNVLYGEQREAETPVTATLHHAMSFRRGSSTATTTASDDQPSASDQVGSPVSHIQQMLSSSKLSPSSTDLKRQESKQVLGDIDTKRPAADGKTSPLLAAPEATRSRRASITSPSSLLAGSVKPKEQSAGPLITVEGDSGEVVDDAMGGKSLSRKNSQAIDADIPPVDGSSVKQHALLKSQSTSLHLSPGTASRSEKSSTSGSGTSDGQTLGQSNVSSGINSTMSGVSGTQSVFCQQDNSTGKDSKMAYEPTVPTKGFFLVNDKAALLQPASQLDLQTVQQTKFFRGNAKLTPAQLGIPPNGEHVPLGNMKGRAEDPELAASLLASEGVKVSQGVRGGSKHAKEAPSVIGVARRCHALEERLRFQEHFLRVHEAKCGRLNRRLAEGGVAGHEVGSLTQFTAEEEEEFRQMREAYGMDYQRTMHDSFSIQQEHFPDLETNAPGDRRSEGPDHLSRCLEAKTPVGGRHDYDYFTPAPLTNPDDIYHFPKKVVSEDLADANTLWKNHKKVFMNNDVTTKTTRTSMSQSADDDFWAQRWTAEELSARERALDELWEQLMIAERIMDAEDEEEERMADDEGGAATSSDIYSRGYDGLARLPLDIPSSGMPSYSEYTPFDSESYRDE